MRGDELNAEGFNVLEDSDNHFFWEEERVEAETELDSAVIEGSLSCQFVEGLHDPVRKHVLAKLEGLPSLNGWGGRVAED